MTDTAFDGFAERVRTHFVSAMIMAGEMSAEEALDRSRHVIEERLPFMLDTPDHDLFELIADNGATVGGLWLHHRTEGGQLTCAVLDIFVDPAARRQGVARLALARAETLAVARGATAMRLTVAGADKAARALYDSLGYGLLNARLGKTIGPTAHPAVNDSKDDMA